jgi:hypothetical protein
MVSLNTIKTKFYTMLDLDLLRFQPLLQVKETKGKRIVFDTIRKKWLQLTPEETVRQLFFWYLIQDKDYNKNRISMERGLLVNNLQKRFDMLVWNTAMQPTLLVECKAPHIKLNEAVLEQAANYNMTLKVRYLVITNGIATRCAMIDYENESATFLKAVPDFSEIG